MTGLTNTLIAPLLGHFHFLSYGRSNDKDRADSFKHFVFTPATVVQGGVVIGRAKKKHTSTQPSRKYRRAEKGTDAPVK